MEDEEECIGRGGRSGLYCTAVLHCCDWVVFCGHPLVLSCDLYILFVTGSVISYCVHVANDVV
jgi:hypothetical protein